jgi:hypothetical protein
MNSYAAIISSCTRDFMWHLLTTGCVRGCVTSTEWWGGRELSALTDSSPGSMLRLQRARSASTAAAAAASAASAASAAAVASRCCCPHSGRRLALRAAARPFSRRSFSTGGGQRSAGSKARQPAAAGEAAPRVPYSSGIEAATEVPMQACCVAVPTMSALTSQKPSA